MKLTIFTIIMMIGISHIHAQQKFEITPQGIVNATDGTAYIIKEIPNMSQDMIIQRIREFVQENWKDPQNHIKIEGNQVTILYYHSLDVNSKNYTLEGAMNIDVKENKIRFAFNLVAIYWQGFGTAIFCYNITKDLCPLTYENLGGGHTYYARRGIYNSKGKLKYPKQKESIEDFINKYVNHITKYVSEKKDNNSEW